METNPSLAEQVRPGQWRKALRAAFPHTIPVLTGFLVLGIAYGILMESKGYGAGWSVLMSAVAFGGSMQYVAITLLTTAFDPLQAFLLSVMVNARHIFYGLSMLEAYRGTGAAKLPLVALLTDETFSVVSATEPPEGVLKKDYCLWVSFLDYLYWVGGTGAGAFLGNLLTFDTTGMDFALTALFVVLFMEQWKKKDNRFSGLVGITASALALALFGAESMVIPAMVMILIVLLGRRKLA